MFSTSKMMRGRWGVVCPVAQANGVQCYLLTGAAFAASWRLGWLDPGDVYDHFGEILAALNLASFGFCFFLLAKGHIAPSSSDSGSCGSLLYDFYWGMELYPRLGPLDLKTFTNCRFGMMVRAVPPSTRALHQSRFHEPLGRFKSTCI